MDKKLKDLHEASNALKTAISNYCRARINQNFCSDGDCDICEVNRAYEMAEHDADIDSDEIENDDDE